MDLKTEFRKILQHYRQKNLHLALEKCDKFLKKFGDHAEIYNLKGLCYEAQNQKEKAITNYRKVLSIDPQSLPGLVNLGNVNKDLKNFDIAEKCYLQVIKINPNYVKAYSNYANLLKTTENKKSIIKAAIKEKTTIIAGSCWVNNLFTISIIIPIHRDKLKNIKNIFNHCS